MAGNFQIGGEHYLYLGVESLIDPDDTGPANMTVRPPTAGVHYNNIKWGSKDATGFGDAVSFDTIRDLNVSGSNNTVDTTTRDEARQGISTSIIATTSLSKSIEVRYKPNLDAAAPFVDPHFMALLRAFNTRSEIAAVDLDGPIDQAGAMGQVANWSVGFTMDKPVQGLVVARFELTLSSFPDWVISNGTSFDVLTVA